EYWTDANIMVCPSDSRGDWAGATSVGFTSPFPGIDIDVAAQVANINDAINPTVANAARHAILSFPISYIYNPYGARTPSQLEFVYHSGADMYWEVWRNVPGTWDSGADVAAVGGPKNLINIGYVPGNGEDDITAFLFVSWSKELNFLDDDGTPIQGRA